MMKKRDLLFELGAEELPPRGLLGLSTALADNLAAGLDAAGIGHGAVRRFATPRRLAVLIEGCAAQQPDRPVERRGPPKSNAYAPDGQPTQAALAFAKSCGVTPAELTLLSTDKGTWLAYHGTEKGVPTTSLLGAIVSRALAALPIPKRMRWGAGTVEFLRPVHNAVLLFGAEVVPCEILGVRTGRHSFGHRFHAPGPIALRTARGYQDALRRAKVIADFEERRELIRASVAETASSLGGRALVDAALLDEVTALVEWPVPVAGRFEERFLALPREVIIATVQDHQRYFPVEMADGSLSAWFITVSNLASRDPSKVREGNERVVRPRLSDASFFWDQDRKHSLDAYAAKLGGVTFQGKLGSYADKTARIRALGGRIASLIGAGEHFGRAADLAKADLMTAMVGEFPELQGTMGRHYATAAGEDPAVACALEEQYRPRFAGDALPATPLGRTLALADKIDTLVGIFAIDQKPTGTRDPFGLRRAALGVLRILLETPLDLDLTALIEASAAAQPVARDRAAAEADAFILDRLRGLLIERGDGTTSEMVEAVLATASRSPVDVVARLGALREFLAHEDATVLTAANKRIGNLLRKTAVDLAVAVDPRLFVEAAEGRLHQTAVRLAPSVRGALERRDYAECLRLALGLRADIDGFFDGVMVMDENRALRENRLALLRDAASLIGAVADLSRLPG
ncbi:MAG: glycine--tRNA ligase subunit beta [Gammaproteobacteria bacterium]|nr:glycine--tRNA ligase subunit beta [Gammaproteobacteria bacterium]